MSELKRRDATFQVISYRGRASKSPWNAFWGSNQQNLPREYPWRKSHLCSYLAESDELRGERKTRAKREHARCIRATDRARTVSTEARSKRTLIDNGNSHHPGIDVHTSARARIRLGADTSHAPNHKRVVCRFTKAKFGPMQKSELPTDQCSIVSARVELAVPQVEIEVYPSHCLPKKCQKSRNT